MTPLPAYLARLDDASGEALATALLQYQAESLVVSLSGHPNLSAEDLARLPSEPRFKHEVHGRTLEHTALLEGVIEDAQAYLAALAAQDPDCWTPGEYGSAGEHIRQALAEVTDPHSGKAWELAQLADLVVPTLLRQGREDLVAKLYRNDPRRKVATKSKSRYLAGVATRLARAPDKAQAMRQIVEAAEDATSGEVTESAFRDKWTPGARSAVALAVHEFMEPAGGLLVIPYTGTSERAVLQNALARGATWVTEDRPPIEVVSDILARLKGQ